MSQNVLKPKGKLLINHLYFHNPEILEEYNVCLGIEHKLVSNQTNIYAIFPYYECIRNYNNIVKSIPKYIHEYLNRNNVSSQEFNTVEIQQVVSNLSIQVVYKRIKCVKQAIK